VYLLYDHAAVLHSEVQNLVVLLIFVVMEFISPYSRKRVCIFRRFGGICVTTFLQVTKYFTPMVNYVF
jgi:hypothetical protein